MDQYEPLKILVIGDTHRRDVAALSVIEAEKPFDMLIHTGDAEGSEELFEEAAGVPCHFICGNCDYSAYPYDEDLMIGPYRTRLTHGHMHGVGYGIEEYASALAEEGVRVLIHGHTHQPRAEYCRGVLILSPGSLSLPRQKNRKKTYMVLRLKKDGALDYELKTV